jgi:hypothetical protein
MYIPVFILVGVFFLIPFMFIADYRQGLIDLAGAIWNIIASTAVFLWNNATPRRVMRIGVVLMGIGAVLVGLVSAAIFMPYAMIGGAVITIGIIIGKFKVAFVLMAILGLSGMVFALPKFGFFNPLRWANSWIMRPVAYVLMACLLVSAGWWAFGVFYPELQQSTGRAAEDGTIQMANRLSKWSLQSEKEAGIFARTSKDCRVYNLSGQSLTSLKDGDLVYVLSTKGKEKTIDGEGRTQVMLPNQDGDFIGGQRVWIPSRNINWDWKEKNQKERLVTVVRSTHDTVFADSTCVPVGPGNYRIEPQDTKDRKSTFQFTDEKRPRPLGDGKTFTVPAGKVLNGIKTDWDIVRVYEL